MSVEPKVEREIRPDAGTDTLVLPQPVEEDGQREIAPLPPPKRGPITGMRALAGLGLLVLVLAPAPFGSFGFFVGQYAAIYAMLGLAVVVVTGYAGLISLMPYSFAGIGAFVTGVAMASWGWPFWLAVALSAAATVPVAILVGITSVRLKGLYLAIATLTFADLLGATVFDWDSFTGGAQGWLVNRPTLGPIDFSSDVSFYILCIGVVLVMVAMVEGLRRSRAGRAMFAVRDNEREAQALGINVYRTKLSAFALGGMIAGVGGSFLAVLLSSVTRDAFQSPLVEATSIVLVTLVAIGGIDRAFGAFFGAVTYAVQTQIFQGASFFFAFVGVYAAVVLILFLLFRPGGLIQIGKEQIALIQRRPIVGTAIVLAIVAANVGVAALFIRLS